MPVEKLDPIVGIKTQDRKGSAASIWAMRFATSNWPRLNTARVSVH
jgi:hypothetical protein